MGTGSASPDVSAGWTTSSFFTFDTAGSNHDTVLYVRDGSCSGPELACDDDTIGLQSEVTVPLTSGQTVAILVDSFAVAGSFVLNVSGP